MRLDIYLFNNNFFQSRQKAKEEILNKNIYVNDKLVTKPSFLVSEKDKIYIKEKMPYVSRGGLKLEKAISYFKLDFLNKTILDIGSSTGGFTDCALRFGAKEVYAIDSGTNQMDKTLSENKRVHLFENTNFLDIYIDIKFDYLLCDVSFVSIKKFINKFKSYLNLCNYLIVLIKPQFEVGNIYLKNGVVKDQVLHINVLKDIYNEFYKNSLFINNITISPIKGGSGNIEFLALVSKNNNIIKLDDIIYKFKRGIL